MMKIFNNLFVVAAFIAPYAEASTSVTVIDLGNIRTVRRSLSTNTKSTIEDVVSFWSALHDSSPKRQHSGMPVVPDIFRKADSGIAIALSGMGVDLDSLPNISNLVSEEGSNGVVGHMDMEGGHCKKLLKNVKNVEEIELSSLFSTAKKHAAEPGLSGIKLNVDKENASLVDNSIMKLIQTLQSENMNKNVVVQLIVEEEEGAALKHQDAGVSRRLEENNNNEENRNNQQYNGYYGYGYYNAYGEYVTPYKSMFQIQYFNVVLWTAIGLGIVLFYTVYLMINMPLMPDTLLFGESAKLVGDD